ncbi:HEPN domain-containing protein [Aeromonas sp. ASNIH5]|uniref:HEPN domain-containing protein n=1 Tax=Aeromonas sp. ASNIH5 TaxID=1758179 RepID=UPI000CD0F5F0|nr:HEPN domain-containing protein [Aeromonas sp. ASNIH5]AUT42447.1 hypothetical protein C2U30_12550 [Aeromonas sp. ASNIH5]
MSHNENSDNYEKIKKLLNAALEIIHACSREEAATSKMAKIKVETGQALTVTDIDSYFILLDAIYNSESKISQRFSREAAYKIIENSIFGMKFCDKYFSNEDVASLLKIFTDVLPEDVKVVAPISGIRLDKEGAVTIGPFEIGLSGSLKMPISNNNDYYICSEIKNSYDNLKAISLAHDEFQEFINLIFFIAGKKDNSIFIKTGLPSYPSYTHQQMYVETSSYQIQRNPSDFPDASISNKIVEKIPVDDDFFVNNTSFRKLWDIYKERKNGVKISDLSSRVLNCSISIGEAIRSQKEKDSVIHTCIALEILLSYDEGSLFQKSIGDRLADTFVFIVAKDKESRLRASSVLKKVYRMRSALVHGGSKEIDQSYVGIIQLVRAAIAELLNSEKYKDVKKIDKLYEMVKDAQNSY